MSAVDTLWPRKLDAMGREHPAWCELRLCDVRDLGRDQRCGNHLDDPESLKVQGDDVRIELHSAAFHDTDETICAPHVKMMVINTAFVDAYQDAHLTVEDARGLAAALVKAADAAEGLATRYA